MALIMSGMPVQMNDHMALTHNGDCHVIAQKLMISLIAHNISLLKPKEKVVRSGSGIGQKMRLFS